MKQISSLDNRKIAMIGMLGAISVTLGLFENIFPTPVPGMRLGLANIAVMIMLYTDGVMTASLVMLIKVLLVPILSGNMLFRLSLSAPSSAMALLGMIVVVYIFRRFASPISAGVLGATLHIITQLWIIDKVYIRGIFSSSLLGWFILSAVATGVVTGIITKIVVSRVKLVSTSNKVRT